MPERDPFDILRSNDPVDIGSLPDARSPEGQALFRNVTEFGLRRVLRSRRLRVAVVVISTVALIAAGWILLREVTLVQGVVCYSATDLNSDRVGVRPTDEPNVELCIEPWAEGVLNNPGIEEGSVPALTGCVNEEGALVVFPTDDQSVCDRLGLATPEPKSPSPSGSVPTTDSELQRKLVGFFSTRTCVAMGEASIEVQRILDDAGVEGWRIEAQPAQPTRPCASFAIDTEARTVILVPIPEPSG